MLPILHEVVRLAVDVRPIGSRNAVLEVAAGAVFPGVPARGGVAGLVVVVPVTIDVLHTGQGLVLLVAAIARRVGIRIAVR